MLASDNGYNLFAHKQNNKQSANEESMNVLLYISGKDFEKNGDQLVTKGGEQSGKNRLSALSAFKGEVGRGRKKKS